MFGRSVFVDAYACLTHVNNRLSRIFDRRDAAPLVVFTCRHTAPTLVVFICRHAALRFLTSPLACCLLFDIEMASAKAGLVMTRTPCTLQCGG